MSQKIDMDKFKERTEAIKTQMSAMKGKPPSDVDIARLAAKFFERDRDITKPFDLEFSHVMRGFEWGMRVMREIQHGKL